MDLLETALLPRHALASRLLAEVPTPGLILLSGPSQSGKTHTLHELGRLLAERDIDYSILRHDAPNSNEIVEQAPLARVMLLDGFDLASNELAWSIANKLVAGATYVCTLSTEGLSRSYEALLGQITQEQHPAAADILLRARSFRIAALAFDDAEAIASTQHGLQLDSVTVAAVSALSWGRPGWLLDLLHLADAGKIRIEPRPTIRGIDLSDLHLPVLGYANRAAKALSDPAHLAAAVVLSELEPRSLDGAADLVGAEAVSALRNAGLLLDNPTNAQLASVPELFAAPLRLRVDSAVYRQLAHQTAATLLMQERLGIPLPDREASYCALAYRQLIATGPAADPDAYDADIPLVHAEVLSRLTSILVSFGRPEARDVLPRVRNAASIGELTRAKAAAVLRGPVEGLRTLRTAQEQTLAAGTPPQYREREYAAEYLRAQLLSQTDSMFRDERRAAVASPSTQGQASGQATAHEKELATATRQFAQAALVFRRWNDNGSLGTDTSELLAIARNHPVSEVALLAEQLLVLEGIRWGQQLPNHPVAPPAMVPYVADVAHPVSRIARASAYSLDSNDEMHDLRAAAAISEGLIALLSATNIAGTGALHGLVKNLRGSDFHELWVRHIVAAINALAAGHVVRAAREWRAFEQRLPSFLPRRLLTFIAAIGDELDAPSTGPIELREPTRQLLDYFRGALDVVQIPPSDSHEQIAKELAPEPLPIFQLITAHLEALEEQNPAALLRAAEHLQARSLWAPAVYALQAARAIFVRRRASGSVVRCDTRLQEVELAAQKTAPWFSAASLSAAPRSRLTKRESDVAVLGSSGFSNKQIAERLQCSVRTIESHLASARAKLGAANRTELSARLQELGYQ